MLEIEELFLSWCQENLIKFEKLEENIFNIPSFGKIYLVGKDRNERDSTLDTSMNLLLTDFEYEDIDKKDPDYLVYKFGDRFYYTETVQSQKLIPFLYVGEPDLVFGPIDFPYLGIHSGFELLSGSRRYKDYVQKIKWLGSTMAGVCEENTLSGVISFQEQCEKKGIKSIIGETLSFSLVGDEINKIKFYVKNKEGWTNLLKIHRLATTVNKFILYKKDLDYDLLKGLIVVITPSIECSLRTIYNHFIKVLNHNDTYFQLDFTEWTSQDRETASLSILQEYILNKENIKSVLINDYYYLEKGDSHIKKKLEFIGGGAFNYSSNDQYLKSIDQYILEPLELIENEEFVYSLIVDALTNTIDAFKDIDFNILTKKFYLPKFPVEGNDTPESLLLGYIRKGMQEKVEPYKTSTQLVEYWERVEREFDVISRGGFIDYFLILIDLYQFADREGIWYGIGRGSSAGCLISYLTGIVGVDPIKYDLFFERFLNEGRLGKSLPDIDTDWQGSRREEIKKYLEHKYGSDQVIGIGTYGTFRLRNAFRDVARASGIDIATINLVSKNLPDTGQRQGRDHFYWELFQYCSSSIFYAFLQKYPNVLEDIYLVLMQPKNASTHAAGVVITPIEFGKSYEQLPVKLMDGQPVSEWEGVFVDEAGFLKIDILGIKQLDKLADISKMIFERYSKNITFNDIELDDLEVFEKFKGGWNEDVFQLQGVGLKGYSKDLQPDNIEDIIATVALYRPGPIESGSHLKYIKRKNGIEDIEFYPGIEEITKRTYGLVVYQEQVMQICQKLADFTLVEADDIRKAMGKMKPELVSEYKIIFMKRVKENGYSEILMERLWEEMAAFAKYAFNRSHAVCYAITGYYCQWFKVYYPLEFWTISLQYSNDDERPSRLTEIYKTSTIKIKSVDINYSSVGFRSEVKTNTIYWSLVSVKFVGEKVVEGIFEEREKGGLFYSFEEFLSRIKKYSSVNKRAITNLIICGAFDEIEKINEPQERFRLFDQLHGNEIKEDLKELRLSDNHTWALKEYDLTGFGFFDFEKLIVKSTLFSKISSYKTNQEILENEEFIEQLTHVLVAGLLVGFVERESKNGKFCELQLRDNTDLLYITVWSDFYDTEIMNEKNIGKTILFYGQVTYDTYKKSNVLHSCKKTKIDLI